MMRKIRKIAAACLLTVLMGSTASLSVLAADVPDFVRSGSISVTLVDKKNNKPVTDGEFTLYKVANMQEAPEEGDIVVGNAHFVTTNGFDGSTIDYENLGESGLGERLEKEVSQDTEGTPGRADQNGTIKFSGLSTGVYLLVQTQLSEGYEKISSFVVSLPLFDDNNGCLYDIVATPKVELEKDGRPSDTPTPTPPVETVTPSLPYLPQTGQLNWPVPVLAFSGLLLFSVGWLMKKGKRAE